MIEPHQIVSITQQTSPKRQQYGRFLYYIQTINGHYYLKYQQNYPHYQHHIDTLTHEIDFYQRHAEYLLPVQVVRQNLAYLSHLNRVDGIGLMLPKAEQLFRNNLSVVEQCQVMLNACNAVKQLWSLGYLHGDLKVEHFVQYQQNTYLLDFEYVQKITNTSSQCHATPHYMAPELFHGQPKSCASELYALGIIFYEWLTGQRLSAKSYYDWAKLHCQQLKISLSHQQMIFDEVLRRLLAKQVACRANDIDEIIEPLKRIQQRL